MDETHPSLDELSTLGRIAKAEGRYGEALAHCKAILTKNPTDAMTHANMAGIYAEVGDWRTALSLFEKARSLAPHTPRFHDDYLYFLHHAPVSDEDLFAEHLRYGELFPAESTPLPSRTQTTPKDKIRVGYLTADLHEHATAFILEPILAAHDKASFEIFLYSTSALHDHYTESIISCADIYRDCAGESHEQIREQIIADELDILIDLGGHTGENNLPVFAHRAAPIQISWFSYMSTSGLKTMDYRFIDEWRTPRDRVQFYTEKLLYLSNSYTFRAPAELVREQVPVPNPLPALANGYITFGSFNTSHKITAEVLDLWAHILKNTDTSKLLILIPRSASYEQWLFETFESRGVERDRILPKKYDTLANLYSYISQTDIALDPFPYTGGATTYHALASGVPSVTLEGRTEYARNCAAIMREAGLSDWIARTPNEYSALAQSKSRDLEILSSIRATAPNSIGTNTQQLVREVEAYFRALAETI